jgi:hypothetical protein
MLKSPTDQKRICLGIQSTKRHYSRRSASCYSSSLRIEGEVAEGKINLITVMEDVSLNFWLNSIWIKRTGCFVEISHQIIL